MNIVITPILKKIEIENIKNILILLKKFYITIIYSFINIEKEVLY